jgi:ABC-type uncharacterized transport system substrate-binding protein
MSGSSNRKGPALPQRNPMRPTLRSLVLAAVLAGPAPALAHPHAWIDLDSRLLFDAAGRLEAIELDWLFDEFYTAFIAEEFVAAGPEPSAFLKQVAAENLANLREYDYFAELAQDGAKLAFGEVRRFETGLRDERLWLKFEVPLAAPAEPGAGPFELAVYDPTYYIEVLYHEGHAPQVAGVAADACEVFVMPPTPTAEQVSLAFMLDASQTGETGLGRHFAEVATIDCR